METAASQGSGASSFWNVPSALAGTLTEPAESGRLGRPGRWRTPRWARADGPGSSVSAGSEGKTAGRQPQPGSVSSLGPQALAHFLWPRFLSGFTPHAPIDRQDLSVATTESDRRSSTLKLTHMPTLLLVKAVWTSCRQALLLLLCAGGQAAGGGDAPAASTDTRPQPRPSLLLK